jgi:CheY-like chemotaxis protein
MHAAPSYADEFHESTQPSRTVVVLAASDDDRRDALAEQLTAEGYEVVAYKTGPELLQHLYNSVVHEARPDLVICSAELQGIDGAEVCRISRAQDSLLPFIVLAPMRDDDSNPLVELSDDACVLPASVDFEQLRAEVFRLVGAP